MPRINRVPESGGGVKASDLARKIAIARYEKHRPFWERKGARFESFEQRYRHNKPFWQK